MAYKLKFTGATATATIAERVDLASSITLNANTGTNSLRVEFEFELDSLSTTNTLCFAANFCRFQILNTGQISVQYRNQTNSLAAVTSATGVVSVGVRYILALELSNVDRNARIFLDGVQVGVVANRWGTFTVDRFGLWPENSTFNGSLYRATCYQNNVIVNDYDPSASDGTGTNLIDTVGGNNGTLVNFPTDNSQWVFYDDGGAITAATAFTMPQFSVNASASNSVPAFTAESAFTMPQFNAAAQADINAGQITAAASFAMPQFSVSAAANNSVPVFSGSASFTMPQFTVAAQASSIAGGVGASVSFAMPQFTVTADAESTLPDYIASAAFVMPQFTVQAVSGDAFPSVSARVLFKMPQFTVESETINDLFEHPGTYSQPTSNPSIYQV